MQVDFPQLQMVPAVVAHGPHFKYNQVVGVRSIELPPVDVVEYVRLRIRRKRKRVAGQCFGARLAELPEGSMLAIRLRNRSDGRDHGCYREVLSGVDVA